MTAALVLLFVLPILWPLARALWRWNQRADLRYMERLMEAGEKARQEKAQQEKAKLSARLDELMRQALQRQAHH